jgi:hypothetical protein
MTINKKSCVIIFNKSTKESFYNLHPLHPELYGRDIFDQIKSKNDVPLVMSKFEYYFVNGLIN